MSMRIRQRFYLIFFLFFFSGIIAGILTYRFLEFSKAEFSTLEARYSLERNGDEAKLAIQNIYDRILNYAYVLGASMVLVLLVASLITFLVLRSIFLRMHLLKQHFSTSDFDSLEPMELSGDDELGELLQASNRMLMTFKEAKSLLMKSNFIENVMNSMTDLLFVCDKEQKIIKANKVAIELFKKKQLIGMDLVALLKKSEDRHGAQPETVTKYLERGDPFSTEICLSAGGDPIPVLLSGAPMKKEGGDIEGAVVTARDLTAQYKAEKERTVMEAQLQHSAKLASLGTLGAGVAHELNNPLAGVKGFAQLISSHGESTETIRGFATRIVQASERMQKTIEHIRRFASDSSRDETEVIDIRKSIEDSMYLLQNRLRLLGIEVSLKLSENLKNIVGDSNEIENVFHNLFSNSIDAFEDLNDKRARRILVKADNRDDESIRVTFKDNATGIPSSKMDQIFDPFFSTKPVGKGTGLGLSIVHGTIQKHGGTVTCRSVEGKETAFTIRLPSTDREVEQKSVSSSKQGLASRGILDRLFSQKPRLLVVDDESIVLDIVQSFLDSYFEVEAISDPLMALKILKTRKFDLILVDIKMPKMSGLEFMSKIPEKNKQTPTVALTGHARSDQEVEQAKKLGASAVVFKPLPSRDVFVSQLVDVLAQAEKEDEGEGIPLVISHKGKNEGELDTHPSMLIVDDEPSLLEMFSLIFGSHFEVDAVSDSSTALQRIKEKKYSVALLDLFMKDTSGLVLMDTLKQESPETIAFIVTGNDAESPECQACLAKGARAIIQKPIQDIENTIKMLRDSVLR